MIKYILFKDDTKIPSIFIYFIQSEMIFTFANKSSIKSLSCAAAMLGLNNQ